MHHIIILRACSILTYIFVNSIQIDTLGGHKASSNKIVHVRIFVKSFIMCITPAIFSRALWLIEGDEGPVPLPKSIMIIFLNNFHDYLAHFCALMFLGNFFLNPSLYRQGKRHRCGDIVHGNY